MRKTTVAALAVLGLALAALVSCVPDPQGEYATVTIAGVRGARLVDGEADFYYPPLWTEEDAAGNGTISVDVRRGSVWHLPLALVDGRLFKGIAGGVAEPGRDLVVDHPMAITYTWEPCLYAIGDEGPGGGLVFYADSLDEHPGWDYMEVYAEAEALGEARFGKWRPDGLSDPPEFCRVGTKTGIGEGKGNSEKLVEAMGDRAWIVAGCPGGRNVYEATADYSARVCADYERNGYDDWFLPSKDELDLVWRNLQKPGLARFSKVFYATSSENICDHVWTQSFWNGCLEDLSGKSYPYAVRPVRAF